MPDLEQLASSYVPKLVAFVLTPILLPIAAVVANWLQDALGLDLNGADLTAYVVAVVAGLALVLLTWLRGRSRWEVAAAQLQQWHAIGKGGTTGPVLPEGVPPGTTFQRPPAP